MGFLPAADAMALMPNILSCLQLDIVFAAFAALGG